MRRTDARTLRRCLALGVILLGALMLLAAPSGAQDDEGDASGEGGGIRVVQVEGLLDPPNASLVADSIAQANDADATLLVLQIDSGGALDVDVDALIDDITGSDVPIAVWVGPSGAGAGGWVTVLAQAAPVVSVSNGSGIGPADPARLDDPGAVSTDELSDRLAELAEANGRDPDAARSLVSARLSATAGEEAGAIDRVDPIVGELIVGLDGETVTTAAGDVTLSTAEVVGEGEDRRREPNQEVLFQRLDLRGQALHTLISPSIAYFLFVAGLTLLVFEFFTASIGIAGGTGAVLVIGASSGFAHLPMRWWAIALLLLAMLAFAVDAQAGAGAGVWTGVAIVALIIGSLFLYGGAGRLGPPWWVHLIVVIGAASFMTAGLNAMIRTRFSTPTVGREGLIGTTGTVEVAVDPDGVVMIDGARWRARSNRATPIETGGEARVVAVEGLVLEVEPPEGAARDYRERARPRDPEGGS